MSNITGFYTAAHLRFVPSPDIESFDETLEENAILNSNRVTKIFPSEITECVVGGNRLKWAFFASVAIWLIGGELTSILMLRGSVTFTLLNLHSLFVTGFGSLTIVLGIILLGRWIWVKSNQLSANRKENPVKDKWKALVRFDDDIRTAAEKLRPFGDLWVNVLAQTYFALKEDKLYLPKLVSNLVEEAKRDEAQRWANIWRQTADGKLCTEESLNILRKTEAQGYTLGIEKDKTFTVTKDTSTTYLRSHSDIQRFGIFLSRSKERP